MNLEWVFFLALAAIAILAALGMLLSRNAVHAALLIWEVLLRREHSCR